MALTEAEQRELELLEAEKAGIVIEPEVIPEISEREKYRYKDIQDWEPSAVDSAVLAFGQGVTFGYMDEAMARLDSIFGLGDFPGETYEEKRDYLREQNRKAREAHPIISTSMDIAGGVAPAIMTGGGAILARFLPGAVKAGVKKIAVKETAEITAKELSKSLIKKPSRIKEALKGTGVGAGYGGVAGVGYSEADTLKDLAKDTAIATAGGGVLGLGFSQAGRAAKASYDWATKKSLRLQKSILNKIEKNRNLIQRKEQIDNIIKTAQENDITPGFGFTEGQMSKTLQRKANDVVDDTGIKLKSLYDSVDATGYAPYNRFDIESRLAKILDNYPSEGLQERARGEIKHQLENIKEDILLKPNKEGKITIGRLWDWRKNFDKHIDYTKKTQGVSGEVIQAQKAFRNELQSIIDDGVEGLPTTSAREGLAKDILENNQALVDFRKKAKNLDKTINNIDKELKPREYRTMNDVYGDEELQTAMRIAKEDLKKELDKLDPKWDLKVLPEDKLPGTTRLDVDPDMVINVRSYWNLDKFEYNFNKIGVPAIEKEFNPILSRGQVDGQLNVILKKYRKIDFKNRRNDVFRDIEQAKKNISDSSKTLKDAQSIKNGGTILREIKANNKIFQGAKTILESAEDLGRKVEGRRLLGMDMALRLLAGGAVGGVYGGTTGAMVGLAGVPLAVGPGLNALRATLKQVNRAIDFDIGRFGAFGTILEKAKRKGGPELAVIHAVLYNKDPKYKEIIDTQFKEDEVSPESEIPKPETPEDVETLEETTPEEISPVVSEAPVLTP